MLRTTWLRNTVNNLLQQNRSNTLLVSPIVNQRHLHLKSKITAQTIKNFNAFSFLSPSYEFSSHNLILSSHFEQRRNFARKGRKGKKVNRKRGQTQDNQNQKKSGKRRGKWQKEENIDTSSYNIETVITSLQSRMEEVSSNLKSAFKDLQVGRANPDQLEKINVQQDGYEVPLQSVGRVASRGAQTLLVNVYNPATVSAVERAIRKHMEDSFKDTDGSAPNPFIEGGQTVVIPFPKSTKENRKVLGQLAKQKTEQAKESIRRIRKDQMDNLKKAKKNMSQDAAYNYQQEIQNQIDHGTQNLVQLLNEKEKQLTQG